MGNPPDIVDVLAAFDQLVEVGVGRRPGVARALVERGRTVTATDLVRRDVPDSVEFVRDDVTTPDESVYEGADAVYALNCPPDLHRSLVEVADTVGAACLFTTLGGDPPTVPVDRQTTATATVFVALRRGGERTARGGDA